MVSDQLFRIDGGKVWLSAEARFWAREWGMTDREMAKFLVARSNQVDGYADGGAVERSDFLPTICFDEGD